MEVSPKGCQPLKNRDSAIFGRPTPRSTGGMVSEAPGHAAGAVGRLHTEMARRPGRGQRSHRLDRREAGHQVVRAQRRALHDQLPGR